MVQNYKRKTDRQKWDEDKMRLAIESVLNGMAYKTAARNFAVPLMSLKRRCTGKNKLAMNHLKRLGSKVSVFTKEQEDELVTYILDMESRMYGLTSKDVRSIAYQLAVKNGIVHPFSDQTKLAGKDWLRGFRERHPTLSLRVPEATSIARSCGFNRPVVTKFFTLLKTILDKTAFPSHRIYNVDETSVSTVPGKNCKVFAKRGRKQVGRVVSAERGVSTTAVICMSAGGSFVPPMLIFSRKRMKEELKDGAPPGTAFRCNDSGWMNLDVFDDWFDHFISFIKPSAEDPALLILDGHLSHTKNLNVIEKARKNSVTMLCLPPHTTHRLQPLDLSFMYPLNHYHDVALEKWLTNHPGRAVTVFQISKIFNESYMKACSPMNAVAGFKKAGIVPFNPDVFSEIDFAAAEVTEQEVLENRHEAQAIIAAPINSEKPPTCQKEFEEQLTSDEVDLGESESRPSASIICDGSETTFEPGPSTSFTIFPRDICPFPKTSSQPRRSTKRKSVGTVILTSTPYKDHLLDEQKKKEALGEKRSLKLKNASAVNGKRRGENEKPSTSKNTKRGKNKHLADKESDVEEDVECFMCSDTFSRSPEGEGWVQCSSCKKWAHDECAGIEDNDCDLYTCDYCIENAKKDKVRRKVL